VKRVQSGKGTVETSSADGVVQIKFTILGAQMRMGVDTHDPDFRVVMQDLGWTPPAQ
jgi:hypothetical protein